MTTNEESCRLAAMATRLVSRLEPDDAALVLVDLKRLILEREMENFLRKLLDEASNHGADRIEEPQSASPMSDAAHQFHADDLAAESTARADNTTAKDCDGWATLRLMLVFEPVVLVVGYLLGMLHATRP